MAENNYLDAMEKSRGEFAQGDPWMMADCTGAKYIEAKPGEGYFELRYLNKDYRISFPKGEISFASDNSDASSISDSKTRNMVDSATSIDSESAISQAAIIKGGCARPLPQTSPTDYSGKTVLISDQTLILMYLRHGSGLPAREQWINFLQLPEGSHHYGPFMVDAIKPMVALFSGNQELFYQTGELMGGKQEKLGDYGIIIPVLPRVKLAMLIWEGDDEFPAKGNILFDDNITTYFDTAGAYVLGINAARRMVALGKENGVEHNNF